MRMRGRFQSYTDASDWLKKGRKPAQGRQLSAFTLRFAPDGKNIHVFHTGWKHPTQFAVLSEDNVVEFILTGQQMRDISASVSSSLYNLFPLRWWRVGMGRYVVRSGNGEQPFFRGLRMDITRSGTLLNQPLADLNAVDTVKRKDWLAALRRFNRAFKARAKLGVVEALAQEVAKERDSYVAYYTMRDELARATLDALKTGEVSTEFIKTVVRSIPGWRGAGEPRTQAAERVVRNTINSNSVQFRQAFGVLPNEP